MSDLDSGRKVFFLYPPSVIRDELINRLLEQEYEVYMLKEISMANRLLNKYSNAICFVNIDAGLSEKEWEEWIRKIMADTATSGVGIGIVSYNTDETLQRKYLMDIGIQCGFIRLKLGLDESTKILLATLKANEAKGRRKYVRASCKHDLISGINLREGVIETSGKLIDISVVGFSCILDPDPDFAKNTVLHDIQLKLRATLVRTAAIVFGSRNDPDGRTMYVMLFSPKMESTMRDKIRNYIQTTLQTEIEQESMQDSDGSPQL